MSRWAIASGDFTPLGGMDRANHALAAHLARAGREVHLVAHRVWPDLAALPGVTVHHVTRPLGSHLLGVPMLARAARTTARALGPGTHLLSNGGNTRWNGATWIHYLHAAYEPETRGARARIIARAGRRRYLADEARALAAAPAVVCNSRRTAADVARHYGVPAPRLHVVYYGVDAAQFGEPDEIARTRARAGAGLDPATPVALFIGALGDRRKGFDVLFDAWAELSRDGAWDARLLVAGAGAERAAWQRRAAERGMEDRLRFLGFRADVQDVMAAADLIVHPARYEAYGLGVHEAVCRGLPAIVSADAGVAERLPAALHPLLLPAPPAARDLVERLRAWRQDVSGWRTRAREAGALLRQRSWNDMAAEITTIVEATA
jgi:glycosyltransferase involved in cell wall biosynthesis